MTRLEVAAAVSLDLALGDPRWLPHPIRGVGWLIGKAEETLRPSGLPLRIAGVVLALSVPLITAGVVYATLPYGNIYWTYSFLALRNLDSESNQVLQFLNNGEIAKARQQLATIVGRDTANLSEPEIVRAAIETVSENLGDGVIAPLFYLALLGPAGMAAYKAVNTLDSMVGYKNERYREFGWASARLDDVLNFIPARLSAVLVWTTAALVGLNARRSVVATLRDAHKQPSPNSGWPEAAFAGALDVQLGGLNHYGGIPSYKAYLGEPTRPVAPAVFPQSRLLLYGASLLMVAAVAAWL